MSQSKTPHKPGHTRSSHNPAARHSEPGRPRESTGLPGGGSPEERLAAEREADRLLPSPAQQKHELAAYQRLRGDIIKLLADTKDTLSADTVRLAIVSARSRLSDMGEHTAAAIDKAIAAIEKEMLDTGHRMGARLENVSARTADVFSVWRDRGNHFLGQAAHALAEWARGIDARLERQIYHTGEIAADGELECTACGERLRLETPAHLPLCPKCRKTEFRRVI